MSISIRLPEDIESRLDALAKQSGRTKTWYIREAKFTALKTFSLRMDCHANAVLGWRCVMVE